MIEIVFDRRSEKEMEDAMKKMLDEFLEKVANEILEEARNNLIREGSVVTGNLLRSGYVKKVKDLEWVVGFDCVYAGYVEMGTDPRAKLPPVSALKEWAKAKFGLTDKEAERVAWAVAKHIKEHGTRPHPYLRPAIHKVVSKYRSDTVVER